MATFPFEVGVQGAKPRKGEKSSRKFGKFQSAVDFAAKQANAAWCFNGWSVKNTETGERWTVLPSGQVTPIVLSVGG
jgi:hypothetical protein